jgi:hypothetical protein
MFISKSKLSAFSYARLLARDGCWSIRHFRPSVSLTDHRLESSLLSEMLDGAPVFTGRPFGDCFDMPFAAGHGASLERLPSRRPLLVPAPLHVTVM